MDSGAWGEGVTSIARSVSYMALLVGLAPSGLCAQEPFETRGLEVDDPGRLSVSLIPGLGLDYELIERVVEEEFALAGVVVMDPGDPGEHEILVIWIGEIDSGGAEPAAVSTFSLTNYRLEFWRPVRYQVGGEDLFAPGMTWVMRGMATGGYGPGSGWTMTEAACEVVRRTLSEFLTSFLKANGRSYTPAEDQPSGCGSNS